MRFLITGGTGFLGRAVARQCLGAGHKVRLFSRGAGARDVAANAESLSGDIRLPKDAARAVAGCRAVFHTAAKVGMAGRPQDFYSVNVEGTRTLLKAAKDAGVRYFIFTSTPSVVFRKEDICNADESAPYSTRFLCEYARTKAQAEREALSENRAEFRVCALRPHLIFGEGDPHLLPRLVEAADAGRLRRVGKGQNKVDVTAIANAAAAHLLALGALERGVAGGRAYFISQGKPVNLWDFVNEVLREAGRPALQKSCSFASAFALGALYELWWKIARPKTEPPMTRFVACELAHSHYFDIAAARRDLHYRPLVSTQDALRQWAKSYLKTSRLP